jgi:hypothetical protein
MQILCGSGGRIGTWTEADLTTRGLIPSLKVFFSPLVYLIHSSNPRDKEYLP